MRVAGQPYRTREGAGTLDARAARLAATQHGVFSREQIAPAARGVIRHRVATGRWTQMSRRVFRVSGTPPSERQSLMMACLEWGAGAVASHRAAAFLWRLVGFERLFIELIVPRERRRKRSAAKAHRHPLDPADMTTIDGMPVTSAARTLIDLGSVVPPDVVEEALDDAVRRGLVTVSYLQRRLDAVGGKGRRGVGAMRALLDAREEVVPESVFERRLLRVLRAAGLPKPELQYEVRDGGRLVARVDFAYPDARLAIEADGFSHHSGRPAWERDRARGNVLVRLGWRVIRVTWRMCQEDPRAVTDAIARTLRP